MKLITEWRLRRKAKHLVKHLLHEAQHAQHMREDVAPASSLKKLEKAKQELRDAWKMGQETVIEPACERLAACINEVYPARSFPKWRENVEILAVALSVAMAFRTYFIQPFKIPTGSMQPTLYGITAEPQTGRQWMDRFPLWMANLALFGERYVEVRAKASGRLEFAGRNDDQYVYRVNGIPHLVRLTPYPESMVLDPSKSMTLHANAGDHVNKGDLIASGRVIFGDHIFVDKIRNNLKRPKRGDIIVFDTNLIKDPRIRPDSFYIKRLVGLRSEEIAISTNRELLADGKAVLDPYPFKRLLTDTNYCGYVFAGYGQQARLSSAGDVIHVGTNQFLPFGDNTRSSLDGRYFGPIEQKSLVGPAFMVYWPLSKRWGRIK